MSANRKSYLDVIKKTTLFGGVQVVQILSVLVRGKVIALLLGTTGIGIYTIYNSVVTLVVQFASFGLNFSAVRDISQATESNDVIRQGKIIKVFRKWILFCSFFGATIIGIGSYWLSKYSFGNSNYTWAFVGLMPVVFLTILNSGYIAVLQGTRNLKSMATASVLGSIIGILLCVPLFYLFRVPGIVLGLIAASLISAIMGWYFSRKVEVKNIIVTLNEAISDGSEMAKLGLAMMVATLIGSAVNYIIVAYISKYGSVADVGLFGAGMSITNQYIGLVFTAMAVDYFPRLSAVCSDRNKVNEMVNQQAEMVLLIVCPLLICMMLSAPLLIRILLSSEFLAITDFVCWGAFAMIFKSAAFAIGYISFAKGDKKIFFLFEGIFNSLVILITSIFGYRWFGINGVAIATVISNMLYIINVNLLAKWRYGLVLTKDVIKIFAWSVLLVSTCLFITLNFSNIYGYTLVTGLLILSVIYSIKLLDRKTNFVLALKSKIMKKNLS